MLKIALLLILIAIVIMAKDIAKYVQERRNQNLQSREILDLIKQKAPVGPEPTFTHDIQPDFSGYFN